MRIAVLADIHGNLHALEAVLRDLRRTAPDLIVNLGDCVSGPLDAGGTARRLMDLGWPTVRGNHDRWVVHTPVAAMGLTDSAARARLDDAALAWLGALPVTLEIEGLLLVHATPSSDTTYLCETVTPSGVMAASEAEIAARLGAVGQRWVLTGHTHIPRLVRLASGTTIVNPGSVGLQAFDDDMPLPHVVETGSPHARYAVLDRTGADWRVTFETVEYDWDAAARLAAANRRPEWAHALATGFALRPAVA